MRFDDSLRTVLAIDTATPFGASAAWRQLVDLIGRGRAAASPEAMDRLHAIRPQVPPEIRAASARGLALAAPGAALAGLFAEEPIAVAAPVLRAATMPPAEWVALIPTLTPALRAVLRHRRDLPAEAEEALARLGPTDFVLPPGDIAAEQSPAGLPAPLAELEATAPAPEPVTPIPPLPATPFVAVGEVAAALPLVAEARRQAAALDPGSPIADLVARIDAFTSRRVAPDAPSEQTASRFRFETDVAGRIRWVEGAARAPLVGLSIAERRGTPSVDGVAAGAFRHRAPFRDARLEVSGASPVAGSWRIAGTPQFDPATGRFTGYRGVARRPRADESASPRGADSLRQLVHELRTPTNAISGFAEFIEAELLGPVPDPYRVRARAIRDEAAGLTAAIDDLDTAARIAGRALELREEETPLAPLVARAVADLAPLARLRGAGVRLTPIPPSLVVAADARALERLVGRLLAALVATAARGEVLHLVALAEGGRVLLVADRPAALATAAGEGLLSIDAEAEAAAPGGPLLGTGFALRLARNLAAELGGALTIDADALTLALPAAAIARMDRVPAL